MKPAVAAHAPAAVRRLFAVAVAAAAWTAYLPIGAKYLSYLVASAAALALLQHEQRLAQVLRQPGAGAGVALVGLLALSSLWSPAPAAEVGSHLWLYGLLLLLPAIACACDPATARLALSHFAAASALVGLLFLFDAAGALPPLPSWSPTDDTLGNQRIANSLLLALGAAIGLWLAAQPAAAPWRRVGWLAAAAVAALGLALQDRRSGMLLLPLLLLAWSLASPARPVHRGAAALAVVLVVLAAWTLSDGIRARMAEGIAELRQYEPNDAVDTSWGQRLRMLEITAAMVRERPWLGHGVASWETLWQARTRPGTLLAGNRTPHNEYLLVAQQTGLAGLALLLVRLLAPLRAALRAGAQGLPMLMVWLAIASAGMFHAVLRDAKFSLPLLMLASVTTALVCGAAAAVEPGRIIRDNRGSVPPHA